MSNQTLFRRTCRPLRGFIIITVFIFASLIPAIGLFGCSASTETKTAFTPTPALTLPTTSSTRPSTAPAQTTLSTLPSAPTSQKYIVRSSWNGTQLGVFTRQEDAVRAAALRPGFHIYSEKGEIVLSAQQLLDDRMLQVAEWDLSPYSNAAQGWHWSPTQKVIAIVQKYDMSYRLPQSPPQTVYLTFNCGYEISGRTAALLSLLKRENVKATFFLNGTVIHSAPETAKQMFTDGHLVGSHGLDHLDAPTTLEKKGQVALARDLIDVMLLYQEKTGYPMSNVTRPPSGNWSERAVALYNKLGFHVYEWSFANRDWNLDDQPDADEFLANLKTHTYTGSIIALHPISPVLAQILPQYLVWAKENGFRFARLPEPTR